MVFQQPASFSYPPEVRFLRCFRRNLYLFCKPEPNALSSGLATKFRLAGRADFAKIPVSVLVFVIDTTTKHVREHSHCYKARGNYWQEGIAIFPVIRTWKSIQSIG